METVVLVHGIWMTGFELGLLASRLRACGFDVQRFSYPSLRFPPSENANNLNRFIANLHVDSVHLVAHSLGGIVALHLFEQFPAQPPGRLVLVGSPVRGSGVARRLAGFPLTRPLMGQSLEQGLGEGAPAWDGDRPLGIIAGTGGPGVGSLIGGLAVPNDGTVALEETQLEGAADRVEVSVSHMGLVFSREVAEQACCFLQKGYFRH